MHPCARMTAAACLLLTTLSLPFVSPVAAGPSPPEPSRDINSYVLFAYSSLSFKGRDANITRGFISGGNVGVNNVDPQDPPQPLLSMGGGGSPHAVVLGDNTQVVCDTGRLDEDAGLWDLFINRRVGSTAPAIRNSGPFTFAAPIIAPANLPQLPPCAPGVTPVTVQSNTVITLPPGSYGPVQVKDDGTLILQPGLYDIQYLHCGRRVHISTVAGIELRISEDFSMNNGSYFGPACNVHMNICSNNVGSNNASASFGRNSTFYGHIFAPNGSINLGHTTDLYGSFWCDEINSDFNVNVAGCSDGTSGVRTSTWGRVRSQYR